MLRSSMKYYIVEKLTDEYDVSKDKAEEDLKIILDCLDDAGLIVK